VWTALAENCAQYLARHRQFYIECAIRKRDPPTNEHRIASDASWMDAL
jgi:hypothetical protein